MLDLRLVRSGASQHVFVRADDDDDSWVYKTPAIRDELLPASIDLHQQRPTRLFSRLVYSALFTAPRRAWRAYGHAIEATRAAADPLAPVLVSCRAMYLAGISHLHAFHLRRARVRQFRRVVRLHEDIARSPAADVLLPFRILSRVPARLLFPSATLQYDGPMIQQRRADAFFDRIDDIACLDRDALVEAEHRLWRHGIGIADGATAIGPFGWCTYAGQLRLGDTGSLSMRLAQVQHCLEEVVDDRWRRRFTRLEGERQRAAQAYFAHVRAHLDAPTLRRMWRANGRDNARAGTS